MAASPRTPKTSPKGRPAASPAEASPRIARRQRRRERSREEIVEATRRVLLRNGIAATTLDAVAQEVGLTKAALYYYYPSKDALLFEVIFNTLEAQSRAVHRAVERSENGGEALGAIIRETFNTFASSLDDFRLAYLHGQVATPGTVRVAEEQLARIRPLNDQAFAGAAQRLAAQWEETGGADRANPRLMAFLAHLAAIGLLTMKGMVESIGDPLLYSDQQLVEGLAQIFETAARP